MDCTVTYYKMLLCAKKNKAKYNILLGCFSYQRYGMFVYIHTYVHICLEIGSTKANSYKVEALDQLMQITMLKNFCFFFLYFVLIINFVFSYCVKSLFIFLLTCFCICMYIYRWFQYSIYIIFLVRIVLFFYPQLNRN